MQQNEQTYRPLTREEKRDILCESIKNGFCPFCTVAVYCLKDLCFCIDVKLIPVDKNWDECVYTMEENKFIKSSVVVRDLELELWLFDSKKEKKEWIEPSEKDKVCIN